LLLLLLLLLLAKQSFIGRQIVIKLSRQSLVDVPGA